MKVWIGLRSSESDLWAWQQWLEPGEAILRDWVLLFGVPERSRDFTLWTENTDSRKGEALIAAIPIDR